MYVWIPALKVFLNSSLYLMRVFQAKDYFMWGDIYEVLLYER